MLALVCGLAGCAFAADTPDSAPAASAHGTQAAEGAAIPAAEMREDAANALEELRESATYGEELALFLKKYGSVLSKEQADDALSLLEDVLEREKKLLAPDYEYANADDTFKAAFKNGFFRQNTYLLSEELRALVEGTLLDGFKLVKSDGKLVPQVDYSALLARYGELCSQEYKEYFEMCAELPSFVFEPNEAVDAKARKSSIAAFEAHAEKYSDGITSTRVKAILDILKSTKAN